MRRRCAGSCAAAFLFLAIGCAVGPDYVPPEPELPDAWHLELAQGLAEGEADLRTWWKSLEDPLLDSLIERAGEGNLDLRVALARVMESRAQRGVARGQWFPGVFGAGSWTHNQVREDIAAFTPGGDRTFNASTIGLDASWEIDIFGRIRRSTESADASLMASIEDYRDVLVLLYAEVAANYVEVRALQERVRYAVSNVEAQEKTLQLTRDRNAAGLASDLDVRQAELNLERTRSLIPFLENRLGQTIHGLGVLLGTYPDALYEELATPLGVPQPPPEVGVGLPTNLLRQRPDIRAAERQIAAQSARIGVATADLYPRFALLGTFAFDAFDIAELFTKGSMTYGVGPTFRWNIFDGGRVRNNIRVEDARTEALLASYEQTLLRALEDVENAMVAYTREIERREYLAASVTAAQQSVDLVLTLYRTGLTNFQNVLDMERSLFQQQDQFAASDGRVTQNLIRLYRALGGGWDPEESAEAIMEEASGAPTP